jgi:hypothetical protein
MTDCEQPKETPTARPASALAAMRRHTDPVTPRHMAQRQPSYAPVGATCPGDERWAPPAGFRPYERTARLGQGQECWPR